MHVTKVDGLVWAYHREPAPRFTMGDPSPRRFGSRRNLVGVVYSDEPVGFFCPQMEYTIVVGDEEIVFWGLEPTERDFDLSGYEFLDVKFSHFGQRLGSVEGKYEARFEAISNSFMESLRTPNA